MMTKQQAEQAAKKLGKQGRATVLRHEQSGWVVEFTPAPREGNDGTLYEQPTRIVYSVEGA